MITQFGIFCRKLRLDNGELLKHMAVKLGVSSSYLSAVEVGKRKVPQDWIKRITDLYSLNAAEVQTMKDAVDASQVATKLDMQKFSIEDRSLMMAFAREIKNLDEDNKSEIFNILRRNRKDVDM
ncbi:hypothetical protein J41TS12_23310 [Paenibacillus antibioticophila]|uniref:XRE family transcriptional regulator n=1 Tax=Paenibacillus antibioticophila TaxID=1274374 RepID=A0A919XV69_9BACL|nr:helix-turn-helix transcriptional regulator [Paenibacillus antibioticophila]GIO37470.1 hypothetical protein J41TS12_23310 [Paenibacillus antibioticophila]